MNIRFKKLKEQAIVPKRGSLQAAGADLYALVEGTGTAVIGPHETKLIGTGLAMAIPDGYFGGIFARSGLALKQGLRPANCVGVVDSDYRGEVMVALHNDSNEVRYVHTGDRIAQLVVMPYLPLEFSQVEDLDETERGEGGFGHTGLQG